MSMVPGLSRRQCLERFGVGHRVLSRVSLFTLVFFAFAFALGFEAKADRIALRNARVIADRTVVSFDEDGVRLDGTKAPQVLGWEEIESASVAKSSQARFDLMLKDLGEPLFRLQRRMKTGDSRDYGEFAEALYPRFASRKSSTALLVCLATLRSRLATRQRELALEPYLRSFELIRSGFRLAQSAGRPLDCSLSTGLSVELSAVWFDSDAAKAAMPDVREAIGAMAQPVPEGVYLYASALALTAGEGDAADEWLKRVKATDRAIETGLMIVQAQREAMVRQAGPAIQSLESKLNAIPAIERPAAYYWLGMGLANRSDPRERLQGALVLLRLPAQYGEKTPELAAAGLHQAAKTLEAMGDSTGAITLRNELLVRFGNSYHASQLELDPKTNRETNTKTQDDANANAKSAPRRKG